MNEYKAVFPSVIYFIPDKQKKKKSSIPYLQVLSFLMQILLIENI